MFTMNNRIRRMNFYTDKMLKGGLREFAVVAGMILIVSICSAKKSDIPYNRYNGNFEAEKKAEGSDTSLNRLIELAKSDHIELLEWCASLYRKNVKDYTAILHKQERIDGELRKPQEIVFWFKEEPYSLLMKWKKNALAIDKLLYIEGENNDNMYVHPTGPWSWIKSVTRKPKCKEAMNASLKTADEFGFYRNMLYLHRLFSKAEKYQSLEMEYLGKDKIYGRETIVVQTILTSDIFEYRKIIMHFDKEYILPVALSYYGRQGRLYGRYAFSNLRLNVGLSEKRFCKDINEM